MSVIEGIILGIVQGATEFLPISSSGHLIVVRELFGFGAADGLGFDAVLQLATILAVGISFRRDFRDMAVAALRMIARKPVASEDRIRVLAVVLGTIPAIVFGLLLEGYMETVFRSAKIVAVTLVVGALLMWVAERIGRRKGGLTVGKGVAIGCFQTLALVPGMSRSGSTIAGGLFMGLGREEAARFSFLLAFPIIAGSGLKKLLDLGTDGALADLGAPLAAGFVAAFVVGMAAIHYLLRYLRTNTLMAFVWYRIGLAAVLFLAV